ncbi:hypothetical protein ABZ746_37510 [Streptomyces sp. NPDC020096]
MVSIRTDDGIVYLRSSCRQPCYGGVAEGELMLLHFKEQWDGIHCPMFPLAADPIAVDWDAFSLQDLKEQYPDTYPHVSARAV